MHQSETEERSPCADCGADLGDTPSPVFNFGEDSALCWKCAVKRGGSYDGDKERWTKAPDLKGLVDTRRPHP